MTAGWPAALRILAGYAPPAMLLLVAASAAFPRVAAEQPAAMLSLSFSAVMPSRSTVYSSRAAAPIRQLQVVNGGTVRLLQQSGRSYRVRAGGWWHTQVEEVPEDGSAVVITPTLNGSRVQLAVQVYRQNDDSATALATTVAGAVGEWVQLLAPKGQVGAGSKAYSTAGAAADDSAGLFVRVEVTGGDR